MFPLASSTFIWPRGVIKGVQPLLKLYHCKVIDTGARCWESDCPVSRRSLGRVGVEKVRREIIDLCRAV